MRFRITVRGDRPQHAGRLELRGYFDGELADLGRMADMIDHFGLVIASPADNDYDPFVSWEDPAEKGTA